jgi:hypothetical protein
MQERQPPQLPRNLKHRNTKIKTQKERESKKVGDVGFYAKSKWERPRNPKRHLGVSIAPNNLRFPSDLNYLLHTKHCFFHSKTK